MTTSKSNTASLSAKELVSGDRELSIAQAKSYLQLNSCSLSSGFIGC